MLRLFHDSWIEQIQAYWQIKMLVNWVMIGSSRDHSVYGPSPNCKCYTVSHWLGSYTEWSLLWWSLFAAMNWWWPIFDCVPRNTKWSLYPYTQFDAMNSFQRRLEKYRPCPSSSSKLTLFQFVYNPGLLLVKSTDARSSNKLMWLDLKIGCPDISPSNYCHCDTPYSQQTCCKFQCKLRIFRTTRVISNSW